MAKKRVDDLERDMERVLRPGTYVGPRERADFMEAVEAIRAKITPLIREDGGAARAVALLELFIAACYGKAEDIDDAGDGFGAFVGDLFCDWIRARQAEGASPDETVKLLFSWVKNDDYGYCHNLDKTAIAVLDRGGLRALERTAHEMSDACAKESNAHNRSLEVLKAIHVKRGDARAYQALCETEQDLAPADCEKLAEMSLKRRRLDDALTWVEQGLELEKQPTWSNRSAWRLPHMLRDILKRLGRDTDALESAWEAYRRAPSTYSYKDLMKFAPKGERREWHQKALAALDDSDLSSRIDLLVGTKEWNLLAATIESASRDELIALSHYTTEPAAKGLTKAHPLLAARLDVAMALRIVQAGKSKYYDAALRNLEQARRAMLKHGRSEEWATFAAEIRMNHRRKSGFISDFEKLTEGRSTRTPSFTQRARARWRTMANGQGA